MYDQEKIKPYSAEGRKGEQVAAMFDSIAHSYDLLNHTLSFGIDKLWRRRAINSLKKFRPRHILDVATGTGDFAILAAKKLHPESLTGIDLSLIHISEPTRLRRIRHPCSQKVTSRKPYGYRHLRRNARNRAEKSGRKRLVRHYLIQQRRLHEPAFCRRHIRRRNCGIRRKEF